MCDVSKNSNKYTGSYGKITFNDTTAIKTMDKFNSTKTIYKKQNVQETIFLTTVRHDNIIQLKDVTIDATTLVMELERQTMTLSAFITTKSHNERMAKLKFIMFEIVTALHFLHKNKFIHGDIKPGNIVLNNDATVVKLIDFGGICSFRLNPTHRPICTPSFCAPEGWPGLNFNSVNCNFDVWSLGNLVYYYITKEYLFDFENDKSSLFEQNFKTIMPNKKSHPITKIKNIINNNLYELMENMLVYDPNNRISIENVFNNKYFDDLRKDEPEYVYYSSDFEITFLKTYDDANYKKREELIDYVRDILTKIDCLEYLVLAVWIMDKYVTLKKSKIGNGFKVLGISTIVLVSIMLSKKIYTLKAFTELEKKITTSQITKKFDDILSVLNFNVYTNTFDNILNENKQKIDYDIITEMVKNKKLIGMDQKILHKIYLKLLK